VNKAWISDSWIGPDSREAPSNAAFFSSDIRRSDWRSHGNQDVARLSYFHRLRAPLYGSWIKLSELSFALKKWKSAAPIVVGAARWRLAGYDRRHLT
jgi:hypothetical protein